MNEIKFDINPKKAPQLRNKGYDFYFAVTGTRHGSFIHCHHEGQARRIFHKFYKGESIISMHITILKRGIS